MGDRRVMHSRCGMSSEFGGLVLVRGTVNCALIFFVLPAVDIPKKILLTCSFNAARESVSFWE